MEPTMRDELWPRFYSERKAATPPGKQKSSSSAGDAAATKKTSDVEICEMIERAFSNVKSFPLERIIFQFWRKVNTLYGVGATLLSCRGTPFAFPPANQRLRKYKTRSISYRYGVAAYAEDDPMIISCAPPAVAFLRRFPEVVLDLSLHKGTPLVDLALECELTCFMMLPVFWKEYCLGVIEVSARFPRHLLILFNELHHELKRVGLSIDRPKEISLPWKAISGDLNLARTEAANALKVAVLSHDLTLAQVWTPYISCYRRLTIDLLRKLTSYCVHKSDAMSSLKRFYQDLVYLPLVNGPGLLAKTLETHQPQLCRNIHNFTENGGLTAMVSANTKSTACFVICLRSSHTGDLDHVFEFLWPQHRDHMALIEALLSTLRQHLPSFRYDSTAQLGDLLLVADVDSSPAGSASATTFNVFPGNKSPDKNLKVSSVGTKRKTMASAPMLESQSSVGQSESNQYPLTNICNVPEGEDDDDLAILAVYKVDHGLFFLPSSSPTFESLMEKINQEFELNPAKTYRIEYQVLPGEWHRLVDDTCLKSCIALYQASKDINHIKVCVLDS